jgi:hypothetical protein
MANRRASHQELEGDRARVSRRHPNSGTEAGALPEQEPPAADGNAERSKSTVRVPSASHVPQVTMVISPWRRDRWGNLSRTIVGVESEKHHVGPVLPPR